MNAMDTTSDEHQSTALFRDYLRIKTNQPDPDYATVRKFLEDYAARNGFKCRVFEAAPNRPVVIMTVEGLNPELPSVLLNSHTDVACVSESEGWTYDPFGAHKTENGDIYARGSQDMKCVGIQHLEAMRELKEQGVRLHRTVHLSFQPDEQIGGDLGMKIWIKSEDFRSLNVAVALDEGIANPDEDMKVFYTERMMRWGYFVAKGTPGYGSSFIPNTAGPKISKILQKIVTFRDEQEAILNNNDNLTGGDVCSVNITALKIRAAQLNSIPDELRVGFDMRVTPTDQPAVDEMLNEWCKECDVTIDWFQFQLEKGVTSTNPDDKWWKAVTTGLSDSGVKFKTEQFPGITDLRYLRNAGVAGIGFSPMNNTAVRLLGPDEYLNEKVFLRGVQIFKTVIQSVAGVTE